MPFARAARRLQIPLRRRRTMSTCIQGRLGKAVMSDLNREELNAHTEATEARVATAVEGIRADLKSGLLEIRVDMERMRGDIHEMFSAQTKWIVVIVFGALAAAGTMWGFFRPPATANQAPYVIYAQPLTMHALTGARTGETNVTSE